MKHQPLSPCAGPPHDWRHVILTVTEQAASMIRELLDHADLPHGAGLSIAQREDHTALAMTLVDEPCAEDLIVAERR